MYKLKIKTKDANGEVDYGLLDTSFSGFRLPKRMQIYSPMGQVEPNASEIDPFPYDESQPDFHLDVSTVIICQYHKTRNDFHLSCRTNYCQNDETSSSAH